MLYISKLSMFHVTPETTQTENGWANGVGRRSVAGSFAQGALVVAVFAVLGVLGNPSQEEVIRNQVGGSETLQAA